MTAEVLIMNKQAVALAADSAVTIGNTKIFNSANKLFMLAPGHSVGILIFNNAQFMGVPWEIIIKAYRDNVKANTFSFKTLEEYADNFVEFLKARRDTFFTKEQQQFFFESHLRAVLENDIRGAIRRKLRDIILATTAPVTEADVQRITHEVIEKECKNWEESHDLFSVEELSDQFFKIYGDIFEEQFRRFLSNLPVSDEDKASLKRLCIHWLCKERWFQQDYSGIVFAGFGRDELFPAYVGFQFECVLADHMKYKKIDKNKVYFDNQAMIFPFAQNDIILMLLLGVHPQFLGILQTQLLEMISNTIPQTLIDNITGGLTKDNKKSLRQLSSDIGRQKLNETMTAVMQETNEKYTTSIMQIVSALPKDELASMAETLVSITSFMRRVSRNMETVGGPVDVAVISKKDGFIWIKRKHYFDKDLNYDFFSK